MREVQTAMRSKIVLLDGAMGTELKARGVRVPNHITSIWSAQALLDAPEEIVRVHQDYITAGADVLTTNNYAVTRPLLARENMDDRFADLTDASLQLARQAREASGRPVRIAGSLPPLETSYRPSLVGRDEELRDAYREMVECLVDGVDLLLCETLSCAREARAAALAACESDLPVWLSWTLQGNRPDLLPSGETLAQAYAAIADLEIDAILVNCCGANFVTRAMPLLAGLGIPRFGGYANSAEVVCASGNGPAPEPEDVERIPLDTLGYADAADAWLSEGATIIGGCCYTRPAHTAELRRRIDSRATHDSPGA